jgi:hypothetical protein
MRAGKSQQWLTDRLHGHAPIYSDDVYLLAKGLNVDPCAFFKADVEPAPTPSREDREAAPRTPQSAPAALRMFRNYVQAELGLTDLQSAALAQMIEAFRVRDEQ